MVTIILISSNLFWALILLYYRNKDLIRFKNFNLIIQSHFHEILFNKNQNFTSLTDDLKWLKEEVYSQSKLLEKQFNTINKKNK